jgi:hypothetical protein
MAVALNFEISIGIGLRTELSLRALAYAQANGLCVERTDGVIPGLIFGLDNDGQHGNFHPLSYQEIVGNPQWTKRLGKVHTAFKRARARANWQWKELDCASSSDALLMNIFCYPGVTTSTLVQGMLGVEPEVQPEFGFKPRTPLSSDGRYDNTEIDMRLGDLLVEAKLTESDFQSARFDLVTRYRDLEPVFDLSGLPSRNGRYLSYQLIRGTLAAYATGCSFAVLCDGRRTDLIESWYRIMRAVRPFELRYHLKLLTWQELSRVLPDNLQRFLATKYGIFTAPISRPGVG